MVIPCVRARVCVALFVLNVNFVSCHLQNLVMHHVDHSAGELIDLLQGLLRYDPSLRMTAHQALRHPFFTRDFHGGVKERAIFGF